MENVTNGAPTANLISALGGAHFLLLETNLSGWFWARSNLSLSVAASDT